MPAKTYRKPPRAAKGAKLTIGRPGHETTNPPVAQRTRRPAAPLAQIGLVVEQARAYALKARSQRTRDEYASQWRAFAEWCSARALRALPCEPATLALYLTDRADGGLKVPSLNVAIAAIAAQHRAAGVAPQDLPQRNPQVTEIWKGIRRSKGTAPRRVAPCVVDELRRMVEALDGSTLIGQRDRALLVVGFAGAFRRSELVALTRNHVEFTKDGLVVTIVHSKTDQESAGARVGLPYGSDPNTCPVRTLQTWLEAAGVETGPIFRSVDRHKRVKAALSGRDVARIVQRTAARAGLDPRRYAGHSLRAGLATSAAKAGKTDRAIMTQGRWAGRAMVDRYVRDAKLLDSQNAAAGIGL